MGRVRDCYCIHSTFMFRKYSISNISTTFRIYLFQYLTLFIKKVKVRRREGYEVMVDVMQEVMVVLLQAEMEVVMVVMLETEMVEVMVVLVETEMVEMMKIIIMLIIIIIIIIRIETRLHILIGGLMQYRWQC